MQAIYVVLAFGAGAVLPLQALINARLGVRLGGPLWAATVSFAVGTLALLLFQLLTRAPAPALAGALRAPAWIWLGGCLGGFYIAGVVVSVPRLGPAPLVALVVFGQVAASLALGHFGVLAAAAQPVTLAKAIGGLLLLGGVILVTRG